MSKAEKCDICGRILKGQNSNKSGLCSFCMKDYCVIKKKMEKIKKHNG